MRFNAWPISIPAVLLAAAALFCAPARGEANSRPCAYAFVIDASRSAAEMLSCVKSELRSVVGKLAADDELVIIAYAVTPDLRLSLKRLTDKSPALAALEGIAPAGKTNLLPALHLAHRELLKSSLQCKHVHLFTDGKIPDYSPLYDAFLRMSEKAGIHLKALFFEAPQPGWTDMQKVFSGSEFHSSMLAPTCSAIREALAASMHVADT